jgi:hypothetical protein
MWSSVHREVDTPTPDPDPRVSLVLHVASWPCLAAGIVVVRLTSGETVDVRRWVGVVTATAGLLAS